MRDFEHDLQRSGHTEKTIATKRDEAAHFTNWCGAEGTSPIEIDYKTCLRYIGYLKERGNVIRTINHKLAHLRNYFDHLTLEGHRMDSPIEKTIVRGERPTGTMNCSVPMNWKTCTIVLVRTCPWALLSTTGWRPNVIKRWWAYWYTKDWTPRILGASVWNT